MNHFEKICGYIYKSIQSESGIESDSHVRVISQHLGEAIKTYTPEVVVKAGIGKGKLVLELAEVVELVVIVEPDFQSIQNFIKANSSAPSFSNIRFVNGDHQSLPLDWYCADMIVCTDYLHFQNVAAVLDEFKRIVDFEGILLISETVLHDDDVDGVFDELMKKINPLHNDYYIPGDLKTVMNLKKFKEIGKYQHMLTVNLEDVNALGAAVEGRSSGDIHVYTNYIEEKKKEFGKMYNCTPPQISENYGLFIYKSDKPDIKDYDEEVEEYTRRLGRSR